MMLMKVLTLTWGSSRLAYRSESHARANQECACNALISSLGFILRNEHFETDENQIDHSKPPSDLKQSC
jgi:hypothetical protein